MAARSFSIGGSARAFDGQRVLSDPQLLALAGGILAVLVAGSLAGWILSRSGASLAPNFVARVNAWWIMAAVFGIALATGLAGATLLFALVSVRALREFLTITPTQRGDHGAVLLVYFAVAPLQYWLVFTGWYGLASILIPVFAFLILPGAAAMAGDCDRFLQRTATVQWGLTVCIYCVSHAPLLLTLQIPGYGSGNAKLLLWLVLVCQLSDVLQYVWGKTCGRRPVAPNVSPNKTWEGLVGGALSATAIGAALWKVTPFTPWQAAGMALAVTVMGFLGGLVMSAIKRDRGIKDYGTLISGHGGVMDRIDSLSFAAPVFFHLTRYWFT